MLSKPKRKKHFTAGQRAAHKAWGAQVKTTKAAKALAAQLAKAAPEPDTPKSA
jgi:hypothetical protein